MKIEEDIKLDFQDVLIKPKRSGLSSRNEVDLERYFTFPHSAYTWNGVPIMVSNMDTTGVPEMYKVVSKYKMITIFHKYISADQLLLFDPEYYALSTGISKEDIEYLQKNVEMLYKNNITVKFICIDIANGYCKDFVKTCKYIRSLFPDKIIIAGNVVSQEMVEDLIINGMVDIVKVGIGSGSVCTTRLQTGVGMPQLSAVIECANAAQECSGYIISDGGIVHPGDIGKAFGGGADFVMCGSMFAGHRESAGNTVEVNGDKYKIFYGMSSKTAMVKFKGGMADYRSSEGKTVKIKYKGPVKETIKNLLGGLRSTCTYIGAPEVKDIYKCCTFIRVRHIVNTIYE